MTKLMIHILMLLYPIYMLYVLWKHGVMVVRMSVYQGFDLIHRNSRKRDKKARRNSGGISVYIKHGHSEGVKPLKTKHTDIAWTKLDHSLFRSKKDIYLASIYISPKHTRGKVPDIESVYSQLLQDIEIYSKSGDIILQGDFNAYTDTEPDFIQSDDSPFANDADSHYVSDKKTA